jgi:hypothetical protein
MDRKERTGMDRKERKGKRREVEGRKEKKGRKGKERKNCLEVRPLIPFDNNQTRQCTLPIKHNTCAHMCQLLRIYKSSVL